MCVCVCIHKCVYINVLYLFLLFQSLLHIDSIKYIDDSLYYYTPVVHVLTNIYLTISNHIQL